MKNANHQHNDASSSSIKTESSYVMSTVEKARTVAAACTSGTLCTSSKSQEGAPFGSHVDYVLDAQGWPALLLNDQAIHTGNIEVFLRRDASLSYVDLDL